MGFGKRHDTTDTTDLSPRQLVTDLLAGNWCNGFWPLDCKQISGYQLAFQFPQQSNIIHCDNIVASCQTGGAKPKTGGEIAVPVQTYRTATANESTVKASIQAGCRLKSYPLSGRKMPENALKCVICGKMKCFLSARYLPL